MESNPKESSVHTVGTPFEDHRSATRKNSADWIVVERKGDFIVHHRFSSQEAAETFVQNNEIK